MSNVARTPENMNTANDSQTADAPPRCAPSGGSALTHEMQKCLTQIGGGDGTITRYPGGFWYPAGDGKPSFGTTTVEALVKRGRLEYCEWKQNSRGQFPIKARVAQNAEFRRTDPPLKP